MNDQITSEIYSFQLVFAQNIQNSDKIFILFYKAYGPNFLF